MQMGVNILVTDPCELEQIRERESDILKHRIEKILAAGANVILITKGIDDMAQKYFVEAGVIACRRVSLEDIQQVAKATGSDIIFTMADNDGEESFTASQLGYAELVYEDQISSSEIIVFQGCKMNRVATLLLRGADHQMLEELERSLNDAFCVIKKVLEGRTVVPGGGTVETVLPIHLESYATTMGSREQLAVTEFADALLVIPITLAVNAAKDATELVANLLSYNYTYFLINTSIDKPKSAPFGLDLVKGDICNNLDIGVIEPSISKIKMLQFATEAAITILRIDDYIKPDSKPKEPIRK
jgi:T-complex protein 1 subunit alpha